MEISVPVMIAVKTIDDMNLIGYFEGGIIKKYNVKKLFSEIPIFKELQKNNLFKKARLGPGGYGIVWNDTIDLSRDELWYNGEDYIE